MKIAIIGSDGVVGRTLVEHFNSQQHTVLCVDRTTELTLEQAASTADVVFIVTLPIEQVSSLFIQAANVMRPETLLVHGTSIECPASPHGIDSTVAIGKGITVCHCHFHFRPERPLRRTLFGQHMSIAIVGQQENQWFEWIANEFAPFQPIIHHLVPGAHDQLTSISQLVHMVMACVVGETWKSFPQETVVQALRIGGPPCRFLTRSVLRTASSEKVVKSILLNHPMTPELIIAFQIALEKIRNSISQRDGEALSKMLGTTRSVLDTTTLEQMDESTSHLIRLEADMQRTVATFHFTEQQNQIGLLAKVLCEFDIRGVDKTSTIAQVTPDGGCIIMIGVKHDNAAIKEAIAAVQQLMQ